MHERKVHRLRLGTVRHFRWERRRASESKVVHLGQSCMKVEADWAAWKEASVLEHANLGGALGEPSRCNEVVVNFARASVASRLVGVDDLTNQ
eukprot:3832142-Pyramimonas_sp.AAC.1